MHIKDLAQETISAVTVNKARTGLTILGIVIGIGSVIAMISIGRGAQGSIEASIQAIGSNLVLVEPGFQKGVGSLVSAGRGSATTLTKADADAIQKDVSLAKAVAPEIDGGYQITAPGINTRTQVVGTVSSYPEVRNVQMDLGSFVSDQNVNALAKVAVLGPTTRDDLFGQGADPIGKSIRINNILFQVIGVTLSKGGSGLSNQDDIVYIPLSTAAKFLKGNADVSTISVEAQDQASMQAAEQQVTNLLLQRHNISDPTQADFQVLSQQDIVQTASTVTDTFTMLLAAIASISLVVGGIGIMNMMLTSVTERTREIGLRKAIGATKTDISMQFLAEAIVLTALGGIIGILLGWMLGFLASQLVHIPAQLSVWSILLACGVSAGIGLVFGFYPARKAAALNPIEALRFE